MDNIIKILTMLVAINSTKIDNYDYFFEISRLLQKNDFLVEIFENQGIYNLYSEFSGRNSEEIDIAFVGHLDVVPANNFDDWLGNPFELNFKDDFFYGRGVVDMKSSIATFVQATFDFIKVNKNLNIAIILTGDEETNSHGAEGLVNYLSKTNKKIKRILIGEPTSEQKIGDVIKHGRRGSANFDVIIHGIQGHVAYPDKAKNPLNCLDLLINNLKNHPIDSGTTEFQPSKLVITSIETSNEARNVIPGSVKIKFNIRYNVLQDENTLKNILINIINESCHGYNFELSMISNSNSFLTKNEEFSGIVSDAIEEIVGFKPKINTNGGTSDGRILHKIAPILEFGPLNETAHKNNEKINHDDLKLLYKIYFNILKKINIATEKL